MTAFLAWLAASRLGRWMASVLAALAVLGGLLLRSRRQGRTDAIRDFEEADRAEADAIRRRVAAERDRVPDRDALRGRRD